MTLDAHDKLLETVLQEYKILTEYERLQSEDLGGVYVTPSYENPFLWFGVIFVRDGMYKNGVFRFTVSLPSRFPNDSSVPVVTFQSEVFHPLISPTNGVLDLTDAFPKWRSGENHVWQILKFVQFILQNLDDHTIQTTQIANNDAYELLLERRSEFLQRIECCIEDSQKKLYDLPATPDRNYICFDRFNPDVHGPVLESMKQNKPVEVSTPPSSGMSWVRHGLYQPLSK
ncbi:protein crossbronx homolog [Anopheles ziemanni]|uniref:protein crossbronx homolog n=1 Tax=Anopheles coustani TaxID=139045 RepID=UPI00265AD100|nr:protein crossbronx homolog [Anopheles coustani]XP_058171911.1 protein crossbronx homolog [Anopheles ziemanni]